MMVVPSLLVYSSGCARASFFIDESEVLSSLSSRHWRRHVRVAVPRAMPALPLSLAGVAFALFMLIILTSRAHVAVSATSAPFSVCAAGYRFASAILFQCTIIVRRYLSRFTLVITPPARPLIIFLFRPSRRPSSLASAYFSSLLFFLSSSFFGLRLFDNLPTQFAGKAWRWVRPRAPTARRDSTVLPAR